MNREKGKWKKKITLVIMLTVLLLSIKPALSGSQLSAGFSVHNADTGEDFATIQAAIDDPDTKYGHTILVDSGIYYENVQLWKSLKLIGEDPYTTIIDGNGKTVLNIQGIYLSPLENVTVSGFTVKNGSFGILVNYIWGKANITNNIVSDNTVGMSVTSLGENIFLRKNTMFNNVYGFDVRGTVVRGALYIDTTNTINGKSVYYLVNKSNILIDPLMFPDVGYLALIKCANITVKDLSLSSNVQGVLLRDGQNITLLNNQIINNVYGIDASSLNQSLFAENIILGNGLGMWLFNSRFNSITKNRFENNTSLNVPSDEILLRMRLMEGYGGDSGALSLIWASNGTIIGNTIANNAEGIDLISSGGNTLRNNTLSNNTLNFGVWDRRRLSYLINDVDESNKIDGKPIIYWVNQHGRHVPPDAGYVALINSTNITIKNLNLKRNRQGILIVSSNNTIIDRNKISDVAYGILIQESYEQIPRPIYYSVNNTLSNNEITASGTGILIRSGWNHTVSFNNLSHNLAGIIMKDTSSSIIMGNTVVNSTWPGYGNWPHESWIWEIAYYGCVGIIIEGHSNIARGNTIAYNDIGMTVGLITLRGDNAIYHNNFIDNAHYQLQISSRNTWDNGYPSGGNYWSDYAGVDENSGPYQDKPRSDGIGDTSYLLSKWTTPDTPPEGRDQRDNYPLMKPWMPPGMSADLIRQRAWPEHHHYDISRDEDDYQTLYTKMKNIENQTVWAKTVFNITKDDGTSFVIGMDIVKIEPEQIYDLSVNFGPLTGKDAGKYHVSVAFWYSHNKIAWGQGERRKTFKFTITP